MKERWEEKQVVSLEPLRYKNQETLWERQVSHILILIIWAGWEIGCKDSYNQSHAVLLAFALSWKVLSPGVCNTGSSTGSYFSQYVFFVLIFLYWWMLWTIFLRTILVVWFLKVFVSAFVQLNLREKRCCDVLLLFLVRS